MSTVNVLCGAVTPSTARITAKVTGALDIRVAVSTNPDLTNPEYHGPVTTVNNTATVDVAGLPANTQHWYAVEDNGVLDTAVVGTFKTHPPAGQPASYTLIASGDAGLTPDSPGVGAVLASTRMSNHSVFDTIRTHSSVPLEFVHLGDACYYDLGSGNHGIVGGGSLSNYRRQYDDILLQPRQQALYKAMPLIYVWDDHDFGPNDSDSTHAGRDNACTVYRERVPSYSLPAGAGAKPIYHSFVIGRVQYVVSDTRSDRSPNSDPDDANKTMLGAAQKAWFRELLETSTAKALVWFNPTPWLGTVDDSWSGTFTTERDELAAMFADTGWADRMICVTADSHALGISSGPGNPHGGFPLFQLASMDATPSTSTGPQYDLGFQPGRNQYGTIGINDDGNRIVVTGTGYIGSTVWRSHSITVDTTPPPVPAPPPVATAEQKTSVTWLGCDFVTGKIIAELPDITGQVSRVLGAYTSANLTMPIPLAGPGHIPIGIVEAATEPHETMVVAVVNDVPTWAGIVIARQGGSDAVLNLACVTPEGYLDRTYVRDHAWTANDEIAVIAAGLAGDANAAGGNFIINAAASGKLRNRVYYDKDDATVYSRLRELMGVKDGPEFTVDLDWSDASRTAVAKILRIRPRIGKASTSPDTVFATTAASVFSSRGSSEATYTYTEDYSEGKGSNYVIATGSGEGEDRPQSDPASNVPAGRARWEHRFTPSTSVSEKATLNEHAAAELARLLGGSRTWQITARWDASPRWNLDWALGDDAAWDLTGHRHPTGVTGQGRVIGAELDMPAGLVRPILLEPGADVRPIDEELLVKSGTVTGTPNGSGYLSVTHVAGFTPAAVHVMGEAPITGSDIPVGLMVDTITETTFRVRCLDQTGNVVTTSVTLRWTAVEG